MHTRIGLVLSLICAAVLSFTSTAIGATNASLFVYTPSEVQASEEFDVTVELNGDPGDDLSFFRICIDAGAGAGAQCSEALNHGTVPVFKVSYANAGSYGLSVWMDAYSDGAWRYFGDVAMVQKTIQVTQSDNPQPGTDASLSLNAPNTAKVGEQVTINVTLNGTLPNDLSFFRICIDPGDGSGAHCSEALNHGTSPNFSVTYLGATTYGISAWVDAYSDGAWRYFGDVAMVQKTIQVTQSDTPQPGTDASLTLYAPKSAVVGNEVALEVNLKGTLPDDELSKFRLCIDPGNGSGAQCGNTLDKGTIHTIQVTFTGAVAHTVSAWVDAFTDGAWHFYPEVPKVEKTIKVGDKVLEPSLYLPMVVTK